MNKTEYYPADVFWSDEDEGFIALARDLPGCSAWGQTQADAIAELQHAIIAWVEAATNAGNPIPAPSKPAEEKSFSGKILVRIPRQLHASLAKEAELEDVSLNQYVVYLLSSNNALKQIEHRLSATAFSANSQNNFFVYYGQASNILQGNVYYTATGMITLHNEKASGEFPREIVMQTPALLGYNYVGEKNHG